jgi:hypothetical protein
MALGRSITVEGCCIFVQLVFPKYQARNVPHPSMEGWMSLGDRSGDRKLYPLYTVMPWRCGNGLVLPLYKIVLVSLGWHPGDLLIARPHPPYFTLRLAQPERVIPIDTFGPEVLPPSWPGKGDNATTPESPTRAVAPTTRTNAGDD